MEKKEKMVILSVIFIILISSGMVAYNEYKAKQWKTREVSGYIKTFTLYNEFPNREVLIYFTNATYLHVTSNPFWTYSQLINLDLNKSVTITYQINQLHHKRVTNVNGYFMEVDEDENVDG